MFNFTFNFPICIPAWGVDRTKWTRLQENLVAKRVAPGTLPECVRSGRETAERLLGRGLSLRRRGRRPRQLGDFGFSEETSRKRALRALAPLCHVTRRLKKVVPSMNDQSRWSQQNTLNLANSLSIRWFKNKEKDEKDEKEKEKKKAFGVRWLFPPWKHSALPVKSGWRKRLTRTGIRTREETTKSNEFSRCCSETPTINRRSQDWKTDGCIPNDAACTFAALDCFAQQMTAATCNKIKDEALEQTKVSLLAQYAAFCYTRKHSQTWKTSDSHCIVISWYDVEQ